ncbi:hypothetical protein [Burkholderia glumae]|uniref:hypothetical protein n=1 Tax=Burkholderia glumae TaxID=337 RepID=UPI0020962D73|nr:hypothetical protein [Burkholderia glumae]
MTQIELDHDGNTGSISGFGGGAVGHLAVRYRTQREAPTWRTPGPSAIWLSSSLPQHQGR